MTDMERVDARLDRASAILKELAERADRADERADRADGRADRADERLDRLERNVDKLERTVARVTKQMGGLHNSVGDIVECIVAPGLKRRMNRLKYGFKMSSPRKHFSGPDGETLTEVDLLLENGVAVMAVEVKMHLTVKRVDKHLTRLRLLRKHEGITGMAGKAMYAAVAGIRIDDDARDLAEASGMYIVEVEDNGERLKVAGPREVAVW